MSGASRKAKLPTAGSGYREGLVLVAKLPQGALSVPSRGEALGCCRLGLRFLGLASLFLVSCSLGAASLLCPCSFYWLLIHPC